MKVAQLSFLALTGFYVSVVIGEFVTGGFATERLRSLDLSVTAVRLLIHSLITLPAALAIGYSLVRHAPAAGRKAVAIVAVLWTTLIVVLQLVVYEPRVAGASVLKVLFVVAPLILGSWIAYRRRMIIAEADSPRR